MCENCDRLEREKERLVEHAMDNPQPCLVCGDPFVVTVGTWIAGNRERLAVGDSDQIASVFAFWLCERHTPLTPENEKAISQAVIRMVRERSTTEL